MTKRRKALIAAAALLVLAAVVVGCNAVSNRSFGTTFYEMETDKNISGLRIVALSDLHNREYGKDNKKLVERVASLHPDIIAIVGDMMNYYDPDHSVVLNLVKNLSEVAPVYYSAGNHEVESILKDKNSTLREDIEKAGGVYLSHRYVEVRSGHNRFLIAGACKNAADILEYEEGMLKEFTAEKGFKIFLNHFPEIFDTKMEDYPVDLAICGHAHGGMVRLPFGDGIYAPDQGFFPDYTSGMRKLCGSTVVISRGLGTSHKYEFRINNKPELVVIDVN